MDASISAAALRQALRSGQAPLVIDVRKRPAFFQAPGMIRGALRRDPEQVEAWRGGLPAGREIVVYCVHGHEVSQGVARSLGGRYLEGGIEHWDGDRLAKPAGAPTRWVTRERPKVDRIACPWLIRRFIDPEAEFLYVPAPDVTRVAREQTAIPFDVPDVEFSHVGGHCSFDAFVHQYALRDPALQELALIVRGADTHRPELAPQSAGLVALSLGLSACFADDHEMLARGLVMYDALYAWCASARDEVHAWNLARAR
jgi:rhodanese-related sulfurtransferase